MKYIKRFPNCKKKNNQEQNNETRLVAKFNITDISGPTTICCDSSEFIEIEIDGVVQPNVVTSYQFDTTGEHTVKYTLIDPTQISDNYVFYGCENLISVTIPDSVTTIGYCAFYYCYNLTSVIIPSNVISIGTYAFCDCEGLTSLTIPNSVTTIGECAFYGCSGLTSLSIPNSVTTIGDEAFQNCTGLTSVTIPSAVISIGTSAFSGCSGLTSIEVESGNTKYDSRNNCNAIIESSTNKLICGCKSTVIPNTVTTIGYDAFDGCNSLTSITIPNSVTSIGDNAFDSCSGLTSVTIPNSVINIGNYAFYRCQNLSFITVEAITPPTLGNGVFDNNCPIYVPAESVEAYKTAWPMYVDRIQIISY